MTFSGMLTQAAPSNVLLITMTEATIAHFCTALKKYTEAEYNVIIALNRTLSHTHSYNQQQAHFL